VLVERRLPLRADGKRHDGRPGLFAKQLTVWFSVPGQVLMKRLGMLKPDSFANLRWSLFCGSRCPSIAAAWQGAAPSHASRIYGPTEATIACTVHRFDAQSTAAERATESCRSDRLPGLTRVG
jgi:non-ribosomal peptide synthetase component F